MTSALLKSFDRICIIGQPDGAADRRAMAQALRDQGVAMDGQRVCVVETQAADTADGFPSAQARSGFVGHLAALRQAQCDGVQRLLVLEDNVVFTAALREADGLIYALHGGNWHLAYLGHELPDQDGPVEWLCSGEALESVRCYAVAAAGLPTLTVHLQNCLLRPVGHPEGGPLPYGAALSLLRRLEPALVTLRTSRSLAARRSVPAAGAHSSWLERSAGTGWLAGVRNGWRRLSGAA